MTTSSHSLSDKVAEASIGLYNSLRHHGKPTRRPNNVEEWTVLATISLVFPTTSEVRPISLGTGVKVLPANRLPPLGDAVHDCHAEVLARRGFVRWMIQEAKASLPPEVIAASSGGATTAESGSDGKEKRRRRRERTRNRKKEQKEQEKALGLEGLVEEIAEMDLGGVTSATGEEICQNNQIGRSTNAGYSASTAAGNAMLDERPPAPANGATGTSFMDQPADPVVDVTPSPTTAKRRSVDTKVLSLRKAILGYNSEGSQPMSRDTSGASGSTSISSGSSISSFLGLPRVVPGSKAYYALNMSRESSADSVTDGHRKTSGASQAPRPPPMLLAKSADETATNLDGAAGQGVKPTVDVESSSSVAGISDREVPGGTTTIIGSATRSPSTARAPVVPTNVHDLSESMLSPVDQETEASSRGGRRRRSRRPKTRDDEPKTKSEDVADPSKSSDRSLSSDPSSPSTRRSRKDRARRGKQAQEKLDSVTESTAENGGDETLKKEPGDVEEKKLFVYEDGKFRLREDIEVWLYVSTLPCGDASMLHTAAHQDPEVAVTKGMMTPPTTSEGPCVPLQPSISHAVRGRNGYENFGAVRTKPGRADSTPTISLSCSDKIATWSILGLQGALLEPLFEPVYLSSIIVGGIAHEPPAGWQGSVKPGKPWRGVIKKEVERALWGRLGSLIGRLPPPYDLHPPAIYLTDVNFVHAKDVVALTTPLEPTTSTLSLSYVPSLMKNRPEVLHNGTRQANQWRAPGTEILKLKARASVCKFDTMNAFLDLLDAVNGQSSSLDSPDSATTLYTLKHPIDSSYQLAKALVRGLPLQTDTLHSAFGKDLGPFDVTVPPTSQFPLAPPPFSGWIVSGKRFESFTKDATLPFSEQNAMVPDGPPSLQPAGGSDVAIDILASSDTVGTTSGNRIDPITVLQADMRDSDIGSTGGAVDGSKISVDPSPILVTASARGPPPAKVAEDGSSPAIDTAGTTADYDEQHDEHHHPFEAEGGDRENSPERHSKISGSP